MITNNYTINLYSELNAIILKNKKIDYVNIYLYSNNKKFILTLMKKNFIVDKWSNSILIINNDIDSKNNKVDNKFSDFFYSWNNFFKKKIKFKGKGFRIKFLKKSKIIKFYFGRSHKTFILLKKLKKKRINKYKFVLFSLNKNKLKNIVKMVTSIKPVNTYTLRGIRDSNQIIYKRKGKKGTYI